MAGENDFGIQMYATDPLNDIGKITFALNQAMHEDLLL